MGRSVLIVSPHFPPSSLAGVHRARHMAKHLPEFGWTPTVVRVDESAYTEANDPALAALVAADLRQIRTPALPAAVLRRIGVGDIGLRGYPYLRRAIDLAIAEQRPDVVFFTGFPFYPMLLAGHIKRRHRLPIVLDFQDPWVSAYGATRAPGSKEGLAHRLAVWLEPMALRHADYVTSVSEVQNQEMTRRYPWLDASRMAAIPIGGDPEDFAALRAHPPSSPRVRLDPERINLSYVGAFLPRAGPLARQLFRAAALLRQDAPHLAERLRFNFVGTSNHPAGGAHAVTPLAAAEGVGDLVAETTERVPFLEALNLLSNSQGLILIGSDEAHYTASKIYPALMSGRPYLSLFHAASSAHAILSAAGGGSCHAFENPAALAGLTPDLIAGLRRLAERPDSFPAADPSAFADVTAQAVASRFAAIFEGLV